MASYSTTENHFSTAIILAASMIVASGSTLVGGLLSIPFAVCCRSLLRSVVDPFCGLLSIPFDDASFSNPTIIDNPYWPLLPGNATSKTFTYLGETEDECVVNTVASEQREIKMDFEGQYTGIAAQVVLDREWVVEDCDDVYPPAPI